MNKFPQDIFTEPQNIDIHTLNNLGPLGKMAGIWKGDRGLDLKPKAEGPKKQAYIENIELQPIDPQTNGPQLLYGLRYHVFITKPDQIKTYHEQVGYWLWDPENEMVIHTIAIPRGLIAMATGHVKKTATQFELIAKQDNPTAGISSAPFLEYAFRTIEYRTWSYEQDTVLMINGQTTPFHHTDKNLLIKIGEPTPNPLSLNATGHTLIT